MNEQRPTIGRTVIYRSRTGDYDLPAIITGTRETMSSVGLARADSEEGQRLILSTETHVHLHVFTPGAQGSYQEHDVPMHPATLAEHIGVRRETRAQPEPRTWRWPERV
jgi:hypothetical protein